MLVITGKTASGKDLIVSTLTSSHGFKKIITYTTRPMRKGEIQDVTYHFISEDDFKQKINDGFFAEYRSYNTEFGTWYYGSAIEDLQNADDKTVIILTPQGFRDVVSKLSKKPMSIYVYANNSTIKKRLVKRCDDKNEAQRRVKCDNEDFKDFANEVDKIIYNNDGTNIDEVMKKILNFIKEKNGRYASESNI